MHVPHSLRILSAGALLAADRHSWRSERARAAQSVHPAEAPRIDRRRCARSPTTIASSRGRYQRAARLHRTPDLVLLPAEQRPRVPALDDRPLDAPCLRGARRATLTPDPPPPRRQPARGARPARLAAAPAHLQPPADAEAAQDLPGHASRARSRAPGASSDRATLRLWQVRSAAAAARRRGPRPAAPRRRLPAGCGRRSSASTSYEGAWTSNTGNGYYGGLQMDWGFMRTYGPEFVRQLGHGRQLARLGAARRGRARPRRRDAASRRGRTPPAPAACSERADRRNSPSGGDARRRPATLRISASQARPTASR